MKKNSRKVSSKLKMPTMYDVAKLAGVSQPTVSRVLNNNETAVSVSEETKQRVLAAVEELHYYPNMLARSLRTQRTQTVALLIADLSNGFYHPLARAVQDVARQHDYEVLIGNSDHIYANEKHFCQIVSRRAVDGVIMVPIHLTLEDLQEYFSDTNTPIVALAEHIIHPNIDLVYVYDELATYEAISWMINERGYMSFGFVGVNDDLPPGPRRIHGFQRALTDAGLTFDPSFMFRGDFTIESGIQAAHALMQVGRLPRAVFVLNDLMAIGMILELQEAGYQIPEDIAVMGFDDITEATIVRPKLTTIAQDPRDLGQKLAELLFSRIENPSLARRTLVGNYKLIVRDSA